MKNKIKILFITPTLKAGGAEKVLTFLYNNISRKKFNSELIVIGSKKDSHFKINSNNVIYLEKDKLRKSFLHILYYIIKGNYQIIFSSSYHVNLFLGLIKFFFLKKKFIIRETNISSLRKKFNLYSNSPEFLKKIIYKKINHIIFQSIDMKNDFVSCYELKKNFSVINNPITIDEKPYISPINKSSKFINVGNLVDRKGHLRILNLFKETNSTLSIYGEGLNKKKLNFFIKKYKLHQKVFIKGIEKDLDTIYCKYNFFIQGSYIEGFPNALIEALSHGLPCLVFNSPGGHNEIIKEGFNGFFIEEGIDEIKTLEMFLDYKWDRLKIQRDIFRRYNKRKILLQYESLFKNL